MYMANLLVFNIIWGSISALVSKWPVTRKRLDVERNGLKFGTWGSLHMRGMFERLVFGVIQCTCLKMACNLKMASHRTKVGTRGNI